MDSVVEAKVKDFLRLWFYMDPHDCGTLVDKMWSLARMGGHDLDARFARAGLGAGPEARVAAGIVDRALGGGGCETSDYTIRAHIEEWLRKNPSLGR